MLVMTPDAFDVENKGVKRELGLIKNAVGWTICCRYGDNADKELSLMMVLYHLLNLPSAVGKCREQIPLLASAVH